MPPGKLIPFAKIDDDGVRRIVQGFCSAESIAEISNASGYSEKTCRSIILALRSRLFEEAFDLWREATWWRRLSDPDIEAIAQATVFGCLATCYFNRSCYTNFQQGRRQERMCRSCHVPVLEMGRDYDEAALYHVDLIHDFYAILGIGGERSIGKLSLFRLRLAHTEIVGEAIEATRKGKSNKPDFTHDDVRTVRGLYKKLLHSLETTPLERSHIPIASGMEKFEDLTFLFDPKV